MAANGAAFLFLAPSALPGAGGALLLEEILTEKELLTRFESLTLRPEEFSHHEHVRLAWTYLCSSPLLEVLRTFPENLRRFAQSVGADGLYHQTITWAYLMLIDERIARSGERESWARFIDRNADLLSRDLLERYYEKRTLSSDEARGRFVFPDRLAFERRS